MIIGMKNEKIYVTRPSMPPYEEYIEMIKPLWDTHNLTNMGTYHRELEKELENYLGVDNVSLMSNGHMALEMTLQAMNLSGEVITTPFTFVSTTHAIVRNRLTPVFCDINLEDYTIDVDKLEQLITEKTSAILPVHVYGNVCNVEKIEEIAKAHNLKVIYDAAHAFGVKYKGKGVTRYGDASALSFHATKIFNTVEGGAVVYHQKEIGEQLYGLKNFGISNEIAVDAVGANAKLDELRAIMGICNLKHIEEEISKRKKVHLEYRENLSRIRGIRLMPEQKDVVSNYAYFPIFVDEQEYGRTRDELYHYLREREIYARRYFFPLTNECNCYKHMFDAEKTPIAKYVSERILCMPFYAELKFSEVDRICGYISEFAKYKN